MGEFLNKARQYASEERARQQGVDVVMQETRSQHEVERHLAAQRAIEFAELMRSRIEPDIALERGVDDGRIIALGWLAIERWPINYDEECGLFVSSDGSIMSYCKSTDGVLVPIRETMTSVRAVEPYLSSLTTAPADRLLADDEAMKKVFATLMKRGIL